jgi:transposase
MTGRPLSLDDTTRARVLAAIEAGASRKTAALAAGVGRSTLMRWLAEGRAGVEPFATFAEEVAAAEARCELACVAAIQAAASRSWQAAAFLLERKFPKRWARRDPDSRKVRGQRFAVVAQEPAPTNAESALPRCFILMPPPLDDE